MSYDDRNMVRWNHDEPEKSQVRPKRTVMLWNGSGADIAARVTVAIDRSVTTMGVGKSIKLSDNADPFGQIGGSVRIIPNLSWGEVQVEGIQELVSVADAVTAGQLLIQDTTGNDGMLVATPAGMTSDDALIVARAVTAGTAENTATVEWANPLRY